MIPERLKKIEEIYHEVLEVSPKERHLFLQKSCGNDIELRREVESLLSFEKTFDSLIDSSPKSLVVEMFAKEADIIGSEINQYKILSLLGKGGMGTVYLAQDKSLERKVAIKLLSSEFAFDSIRRNRFFQEAKSASALNHPNILTVHEIGELSGIHYIVTEFIEGKTLNHYLNEKQLTFQNVLEIATQIASALSAAHEAGIIHRDIKPDNVMVRNDGIVKVLDFGIAKLTDSINLNKPDTEAKTRAKTMTLPGTIIGTPQYMSPEQARGQKVDLRTDIFSFGVLLYEMLTGFLPFSGATNMDIIGSVLKDDPKPLSEHQPEISNNLEIIVNKALCKDREQRYQSIKDILADLNIVKQTLETDPKLVNQTVSIKGITTLKTVGIVTERRFSLIHALIFLLVAVGFIGVIWWLLPVKSGETLADLPLKATEVVSWTSKSGEIYSEGTFSPDGKMVAFSSTKAGSKHIWIKQTTSGEAIQTTKDEFENENSIWSPNGEEIAFYSWRGAESGFWRMPLLGGTPKLIAKTQDRNSRLRFWSPTNQVYYESNGDLFCVDIISGQTKKFTNFTSANDKPSFINLSPDEKLLAFVKNENETYSIQVSDTLNQIPKEIIQLKSQIKNIVWLPDGKRLFYSALFNETFQIFVIDVSTKLTKQLTFAETDSLVLSVSNDGSKILFGSSKEESDIWGVNLIDNKEFILASDMTSELWAEPSPDGKTIAYQAIKNLSQGNKLFAGSIMTKSFNSSEQQKELVKIGGLPKWSPDGKYIAFIKVVDEKYQIEVVGILDGVLKQITNDGITAISTSILPYNLTQISNLNWSSDSKKIVYVSSAGNISNIWSSTLDGSIPTKITENTDSNLVLFSPIWSADGQRVAYSTKTNNSGTPSFSVEINNIETKTNDTIYRGNTFIRLIGWNEITNEVIIISTPDFNTGTTQDVTMFGVGVNSGKIRKIAIINNPSIYNIHLSSDKNSIAFVSNRDGKDNIWTLKLTDGIAKKVTNNVDSRLYFSSLAWSPNNSSIFFGKQLRYSLLSMLTNFK